MKQIPLSPTEGRKLQKAGINVSILSGNGQYGDHQHIIMVPDWVESVFWGIAVKKYADLSIVDIIIKMKPQESSNES
jgi:hypothetical protein